MGGWDRRVSWSFVLLRGCRLLWPGKIGPEVVLLGLQRFFFALVFCLVLVAVAF